MNEQPLKKTLVFLESSDIGVKYCAEAALLLGFKPLFLCSLAHYQADPLKQLQQYGVVDCDTRDVQQVLKVLRQIPHLGGVTSFADTSLEMACEAAQALGVPGLDPAVLRLKSKMFVSGLVPEFSPPTTAFSLDQIPEEKLQELFKLTSKIIVKPTNSAGALGVVFLDQQKDLSRLLEIIHSQDLSAELLAGEWIAQAHIAGELISIEGFVHEGLPRILGFSRRKKIGATESASAFPVDATLDPVLRERSIQGIHALVERARFKNGYFHIEYIFGTENCYMIDANMGRVGGGAVAEQLASAYGHTTVDIFKHILQITLFADQTSDPALYQLLENELADTYAIFYGVKKGGCLQEVILPAASAIHHTQILGQGTLLAPMGQNDWCWIGILSGMTKETLETASQMRIRTSMGEVQPYF
jgi:biotin carboxylase